jgi:hypothetical protein
MFDGLRHDARRIPLGGVKVTELERPETDGPIA